jgi:hypothetical protein
MERHVSLDSLPRVWVSGVTSDFSGQSPAEVGLCVSLWSPSDPSFKCRPGIFLPPGWQASDDDRDFLSDGNSLTPPLSSFEKSIVD